MGWQRAEEGGGGSSNRQQATRGQSEGSSGEQASNVISHMTDAQSS